MRENIQKGDSILFFPEGTRSRNGKVGPFKKGAFVTAIETKTPLIPCYISGAGKFMKKGEWMANPVNVTLKIGPVISVSDESQTSQELTQKAKNTILSFEKEIET